ncbi:MAG: hypothetical protein P4L16_02225 [Chlamydiales bacterium]|nr:hypothetical protein [Chlamydiales bacterium]
MTKPFISLQKATSISAGIFFLVLAVIAYFDNWWPGIIIPIGTAIVVRQLLLKKFYDAIVSFAIFAGIFVTLQWQLSWLPVLFVIAGIYILFRTSLFTTEDEVEEEEEVQTEIEEEQDSHKK